MILITAGRLGPSQIDVAADVKRTPLTIESSESVWMCLAESGETNTKSQSSATLFIASPLGFFSSRQNFTETQRRRHSCERR